MIENGAQIELPEYMDETETTYQYGWKVDGANNEVYKVGDNYTVTIL